MILGLAMIRRELTRKAARAPTERARPEPKPIDLAAFAAREMEAALAARKETDEEEEACEETDRGEGL